MTAEYQFALHLCHIKLFSLTAQGISKLRNHEIQHWIHLKKIKNVERGSMLCHRTHQDAVWCDRRVF